MSQDSSSLQNLRTCGTLPAHGIIFHQFLLQACDALHGIRPESSCRIEQQILRQYPVQLKASEFSDKILGFDWSGACIHE